MYEYCMTLKETYTLSEVESATENPLPRRPLQIIRSIG